MNTEDPTLFVRGAELGSLTAAGRDLRLSPAVVSSRIQRLESQLGLRLLNRTTRQVNVSRMVKRSVSAVLRDSAQSKWPKSPFPPVATNRPGP